jgi:adenosylhomocysteine nucleosidase
MKVVSLISAIAEWNAVKPLFPDAKLRRFPFGECFDILLQDEHLSFFHSGWGKIASAGSMQYVIDKYSPDLIVNLGTWGLRGGGAAGRDDLVDRLRVRHCGLMGDLDIVSYYAAITDLSGLPASPSYRRDDLIGG